MAPRHAHSLRIGLISDTHGLLRPEALAFLAGSDHIVHAGDIGDPRILDALRALAPLTAVRGNNDRGAWAEALRDAESIQLGEIHLHVLHDLAELALYPPPIGVQVVVSGHSHQPRVARRDGVLYVNPGSAGPRRFRLPIAAAELHIQGREISARVREFAA
ncbi:MAG TPA: metallophosphoesterase family protein [Rubrivivax sp.]|nr:metallophosphoesterase family protein [Rubrivivax sp.]